MILVNALFFGKDWRGAYFYSPEGKI